MSNIPETRPTMPFALRFAKVRHTANTPRRASQDAAGYDLYVSDEQSTYSIQPGSRIVIPTGIAIELPRGMVGLVCARSGWSFKYGISVANGPGLIDSDYRGEIKVCLINHGEDLLEFKAGDRVAQLLLVRHELCDFVETAVENLAPTARGTGGFGSTGVADVPVQ